MADLYAVLGVPEDASEDAIRRAYRDAARREHPDVSPRPDAVTRMTSLNEAFAVLGDPARRAGYDRLRLLPAPVVAQPLDDRFPADYPWLRCERCGAATADLRFRVFVWVASAIVRTWRRTTPGLFCAACRRRLAWNRSVRSLLLGPWGIPSGPFVTAAAVFRNARGGYADAAVDANFAAHLRQAGRSGPPSGASANGGPPRRRRRRAWAVGLGCLLLTAIAVAAMAAGWPDVGLP